MAEVKEFTLKISVAQAQENIDELNKSLKLQEDLIDDLEKETRNLEKTLNSTSKTNLATRQKLNDKIKQTKERLKDEKNALKDLNKDRKKANETLKQSTDDAADYSGVLGMIDAKTGGLISGLTGMTKSLGGATKGLKLMKIAIIGTGIGALLIAIMAVGAAFKGSEEGQNKFAKIMAVIGALTGNIVDLFADLGEAIISAFENPKQALNDFVKLIKDNLITRFEGLLNLIPSIGEAVNQLFKGNFSEAGKIAADAVGKVTLGVDSVTDSLGKAGDALKDFAKEQVEEGKAAASVADMRAKADKIERELIVKRSKLESEVALLRLKSRQEEEFSATERKAALLEAQKLEEQLLEDQTQFLTLRRDAQVLENTFSRSNKENLTKEAEAIAAVNRQIASRANTARQVQREVNTIQGQIETEQKAIDAKEAADAKAISDFKKGLQIIDKNDKLAALKKEKADQILALEDLKVTEEQKNNLLLEIDASFKAKKSVIDAEVLAAEKVEADKLVKLKGEIAAAEAITEEEKRALEIEKVTAHYDKLIELAKAQGLAFAQLEKAKGAAIDNINEDNSKNEIKWEELTQDQKVKTVSDGFSNLASILGEETVAGKAAAIASATIDTFQSASASYKSLAGIPVVGPALGAAAAGAAIASGFKQVQAIRATKIPTLGGQTPPSTGGGSVPSASIPQIPNFNAVGASDTNQLADALGLQSKQPIKTFVVASDVTTAQDLERNIITGATIG